LSPFAPDFPLPFQRRLYPDRNRGPPYARRCCRILRCRKPHGKTAVHSGSPGSTVLFHPYAVGFDLPNRIVRELNGYFRQFVADAPQLADIQRKEIPPENADRPRSAFIGRQLNEQFEIHLGPGANRDTGNLPVDGVIAYPPSTLTVGASIKGRLVPPPQWPALALRGMGGGNPSAQIEILEICPAARVYRRSAALSQLGIIVTTGDLKYRVYRHGTLGWTAIDAHCPAPDEHVRFQAGPFYYSDIKDPNLLADWSVSYISQRPPRKHPEEWQVQTPP
jgi:hypothetical protein